MTRRLAAILAADISGYSRLMGADETGTLAALRQLRVELFGPAVAGHRGEVVKNMGDGWLVEFASAVEAVTCAMQVQDRLAGHPTVRLRIGVHIGDVMHEDEDIFGDGVNVAARLEALAEPGAIAISDATLSSLDGTLTPSFDDAGEHVLKNISRPVRVWKRAASGPVAVRPGALGTVNGSSGFPKLAIAPVATPDPRAEIGALADSLTSDIGDFLGAVRWLETGIAETPAPDAYVLRVALRGRGERLRLEARVFDRDAGHLWSGKFDGELSDSFDWQDRTAEEVCSSVVTAILDAQGDRLAQISPDALTAGQCLLSGLMRYHLISEQAVTGALERYAMAIEKDPTLADAYAEAILATLAGLTVRYPIARYYYESHLADWVTQAKALAGHSVLLDLALALADFETERDCRALRIAVGNALRRAPFDGHVLVFGGWSYVWSGDAAAGLDCFRKFTRFGSVHPYAVAALGGASTAALQTGDYRMAIRYAEQGLQLSNTYPTLFAVLAAARALQGGVEEAKEPLASFRELLPDHTITSWKTITDYGGSEGGARYFEGLRLAGLPE